MVRDVKPWTHLRLALHAAVEVAILCAQLFQLGNVPGPPHMQVLHITNHAHDSQGYLEAEVELGVG